MDANRGSDRKLVVEAVGEREIVMTRSFTAPRRLVFDAWTKPELVPRWMTGPGGWTMPVCKIDLRVGGAWRFILHGPGGARMGMRGVYREIAAPDRLVSTESFDDGNDDAPGGARALYPGEAINTLTLVERGGVTTATIHVLSPTPQARDGVLASGMEKGVAVGFDRLDVIFAERDTERAVIERIAFTVYPVTDMKRARRFYEEELGLKLSTKPHDVWVEYDPPGGCFALTTTMKPSASGGGVIAFEVEDVDALTERLRAGGTVVKMAPIVTPVCRMAMVADPEGNSVLLHQLARKK